MAYGQDPSQMLEDPAAKKKGRSAMLRDLPLPAPKDAGAEADADLSDLESQAPEGSQAEEGQEAPEEEAQELANVSDDDLLAELKRRGLSEK